MASQKLFVRVRIFAIAGSIGIRIGTQADGCAEGLFLVLASIGIPGKRYPSTSHGIISKVPGVVDSLL
jgi:hypothetical protein